MARYYVNHDPWIPLLYRPSLAYEDEEDEDQAIDIYLKPSHLCASKTARLRVATIHTRQASSIVPPAVTIFLRPAMVSLCLVNNPKPHTSIGVVRSGICNTVHVLRFDIPIAGHPAALLQMSRETTTGSSSVRRVYYGILFHRMIFHKRLFHGRLFHGRPSHRWLNHRGFPIRVYLNGHISTEPSVTDHAMEYCSQY